VQRSGSPGRALAEVVLERHHHSMTEPAATAALLARLRPRTTTELWDAAVELARRHYVPLATIGALELLIIAPVYLALMLRGRTLPAGLAGFLMFLFEVTVASVIWAAAFVAAADAYLGRPLSVGRSLLAALSRAGTLVVSGLLAAGLVFGGTALFIVPGIYALVRLFAVTQVVMFEGCGTLAAIKRSNALARGLSRKILGTLGAAVLAYAVAGFAGTALFVHWTGSEVTANLLSYAVLALLTPPMTTLMMLLYFDARITKEAFDVELASLRSADAAG
jgi:hypothetical protein